MARELKHILYVEDEPDIRTIAELALATLGGYRLEVCDSGLAALARLEHARPDLVLLDVMMPGIDGVQTLERLRALPHGRELPVVFMTAKAQPPELAQYRALGALDVITKPFDPLTLAAQVQAIWDRHHGGTP
jgi:two-component system OmpR family response regulator